MLREAPHAAGCVRPGVRRGRTAWAVCARHVRAVWAAACIKSPASSRGLCCLLQTLRLPDMVICRAAQHGFMASIRT